MKFTGRITMLGELKSGVSLNGKEWKNREMRIEETGAEWPQSIVCRLKGENAERTDLKEGDEVAAEMSFHTNTFTNRLGEQKTVNEVTCFAIEKK